MRNDQRQFYIYDFEIAARSAGATVPGLRSVLSIWERMADTHRTYPIKAGSATMLLGGVALDNANDVATLLVRLSDKQAANSVYSDPQARGFQEHVKVGNQGADFGCHVMLSLAAEAGRPNVYTCAIERVPNLAPDLVRRLLSKLLNYEYHADEHAFEYPHPGGGRDKAGNPRIARCCPHIELRGRPSEAMINDINRGRLTGMSLVKTELAVPVDGAGYLRKQSSELKLAIDHGNLPANLWHSLREAIKANAVNYPIAKLALKLPGSTRSVSLEIDAESGAPLTDLYVMSFEVTGIFPFLAQSAVAIVPHLKAAALPVFLTYRNI